MADEVYVPLSTVLSEDFWPTDYFGSVDFSFLDRIAYVNGAIVDDETGFNAALELRVVDEVSFDLPAGFSLIVGEGPVKSHLTVDQDGTAFDVAVVADLLALRFPRSILTPALAGSQEPDPDPTHFTEVRFPVGVHFDSDFDFDLEFAEDDSTSLNLPRSIIGDTGIIISASG